MAVLNEIGDALLERQQFRAELRVVVLVGHQCDAVDREAALQRRHLEEFIKDDLSVGIFLHVDDDTHALTTGLIVYVGYTFEFALLHEVGNIFDKLLLVDAVRYLSHHDLVMVVVAFYLSLGAHHDASSSGGICFFYALQTVDVGTCRKVRRRNILHQSLYVYVGIVDIGAACVNDLIEVVCGDVGSHTHGYTVATIDQEVRDLGRHHGGFLQGVIEVIGHVDGIFVDVVHDMLAHL